MGLFLRKGYVWAGGDETSATHFQVRENPVLLQLYGGGEARLQYVHDGDTYPVIRGGSEVILTPDSPRHVEYLPGVYTTNPDDLGSGDKVYFEEIEVARDSVAFSTTGEV